MNQSQCWHLKSSSQSSRINKHAGVFVPAGNRERRLAGSKGVSGRLHLVKSVMELPWGSLGNPRQV